MRFGNHKLNEQRTRTWFALFPVIINGESRWLERVTVLQEWYNKKYDILGGWDWHNIRFIDPKNKG